MTIKELLERIKKQLQTRKSQLASDMVEGRMSDFEAYHRNVGIAEGLEQASEIIDETLKKLNEEDE